MMLLHSPRSAAFGEPELRLMHALCQQASRPLKRVLWYHQQEEARNRLEQMLTDLPTGLALFDRQGVLLQANPAWLHIWRLNGDTATQAVQRLDDLLALLAPRLPIQMHWLTFISRA
ncbi:MAG: PAS domain-containing protein [Chloroflexaceae bacterium]|nr:PAS domain-containing protein [Chloroflexaceae bacterium]